jgi:hypothetical protein
MSSLGTYHQDKLLLLIYKNYFIPLTNYFETSIRAFNKKYFEY